MRMRSKFKLGPLILIPPIITCLMLMIYIETSFISGDCTNKLPDNENHVQGKGILGVFLVVLIMTGPDFFPKRQAIRETWLKSLPTTVLPLFAIGTAELLEEQHIALKLENEDNHDLLLLEDLHDSYDMLTSKLINMYEWLDKTVEYSYVLKTDDDTFVQIDLLLKELQEKPREKLYWGFFDGRAHVHYAGKWAEKAYKLCDRYIPYALGGGYVLSKDIVNFVARNSKQLKKYKAEDVSLGSWIAAIEVNRVHEPRFDTEYKSRGCNNDYLITHKQSSEDMRRKHATLQMTGKLCSMEAQTRMSYVYNWNVLPSKCCERIVGIP